MNKPLILITNDDGIQAPGIRFLIEIMKDYGDIVVVAPNGPRSGSGHAISLESIISCKNISINQFQIFKCTITIFIQLSKKNHQIMASIIT